jgi:hypothetical protein
MSKFGVLTPLVSNKLNSFCKDPNSNSFAVFEVDVRTNDTADVMLLKICWLLVCWLLMCWCWPMIVHHVNVALSPWLWRQLLICWNNKIRHSYRYQDIEELCKNLMSDHISLLRRSDIRRLKATNISFPISESISSSFWKLKWIHLLL